MKDGIVSKKHANLFLNFSWLFFFNYLYALYKDLPDLAICTSGLVWFTTILAWTANEIGIYRYIDIIAVQIGLWYQCYRAINASYKYQYYIFTFSGALSSLVGMYLKYMNKHLDLSAYLHVNSYILSNIGSTFLYSSTFN